MVRPAAHSFPHRGSPTTSHTRVRWQPYHASLQSIPPRSSPLAYFVTPASSTASVSPSPRAFSEPDRPRHATHPPRESKLRDIQKSKFALTLVDQAVKSLCDIWPPQDIPSVFLTSGRPLVAPLSGSDHIHASSVPHSTSRNTHLPSPVSPTTQPPPDISPVASYSAQPVVRPQLTWCETAPMKGFVHEVLRRSRTSGSVLQTALCYLEAIRSKVPDLVRKEKQAFPSYSPVASDDDRISQGVNIDYETDQSVSTNVLSSNSLLATVRINPISYEADTSFQMESGFDSDKVPAHKLKSDNASLPPLPPLPSPLLCPRRTFLASLILASKFMQDRCYSNRAWAKLSGLPPREIGRCERALGEALEWRLWVGKLPAAQSTSGRSLTKSKSESDIRLSGDPPMAHTTLDVDSSLPPDSKRASLRRSATVPAGNLYLDGPRISGTENSSPTTNSSSPSTPGLSYSPTPTESSLGDRTVQMTSFMDVSTPPPGQFATFTGAQNDKVLATLSAPLNGLYVSQDISLPQFDSQYFVSGVVAPSIAWMFHDDA
ncbi:hypothetical protein OG21DRAFT_1434198 [Imleria badia]|nr:hypothetical protein OG21DRAFT_1434198 [Imleria badia]